MISRQILIVDDNVAVRKTLRPLLIPAQGWDVCGEAVDGLDAVEKAKSLRPDVVLMDISMPGMNGLEATRILQKDRPEVKVVIVSQNDPSIVQQQVQEVEAVAYIPKNQIGRDLFSTLDRIVACRFDFFSATNSQGGVKQSRPGDSLVGRGRRVGPLNPGTRFGLTHRSGLFGAGRKSLKPSVNLIVRSQHPIWIGWGNDATFLYNDAYISKS